MRTGRNTRLREIVKPHCFGRDSRSELGGKQTGIVQNFMTAEFCDTNVLVYAYDGTAGQKRGQALDLLTRNWDSGDGVISVQVAQGHR